MDYRNQFETINNKNYAGKEAQFITRNAKLVINYKWQT